MRKFRFERLEVWQAAADLEVAVYRVAEKFPADERFELKSQVRRAVHSIPSNIAEGTGRATGKNQANFSTIAYGSLVEVLNHLLIAIRHGYLTEDEVAPLRAQFSEVATKLSALRRSQLNSQGLNNNLAQEPPSDGYADDFTLPPLD